MKKIILTVLFLALAGFVVYKYFLPRFIIRSALTESSEFNKVIPDEVKEQIVKMPSKIDSSGISKEKALSTINAIKSDDIIESLDRMNGMEVTNTAQAAEMVVERLDLSVGDKNRLKTIIIREFTLEEIRAIQQKLNENRDLIPVLFPVYKETLKELIRNPELVEKYKEDFNKNKNPP